MADAEPGGRGGLEDLEDLVGRWVAGWAVARRMPPPVVHGSVHGSVHEVEPQGPERRVELVVVEPGPDLLELAAARVRGTGGVWLTAFTHAQPGWPVPAGLSALRNDEVLMRTDLRVGGPVDPRVVVEPDGDRARALVRLGDHEVATAMVAVGGADAVVDRVETAPTHRRQGLGRAVMGAVEAWALAQGARRGILAASRPGQALYRTLGWEVSGRMTTLRATRAETLSGAAG